MKLKSVALMGALSLALAATFSTAVAQSSMRPILSQDAVIQGLGESFPNSKNVSESRNFRVYEFKKDGITYVQINNLNGEVLTAIGLAGNDTFVLPIGTLAASQVVVSQRATSGLTRPTATATATCPCSAQVVYDGPDATIVVVYGEGGEVIEVVTILKTIEP